MTLSYPSPPQSMEPIELSGYWSLVRRVKSPKVGGVEWGLQRSERHAFNYNKQFLMLNRSGALPLDNNVYTSLAVSHMAHVGAGNYSVVTYIS
jgi:hypothetical protein